MCFINENTKIFLTSQFILTICQWQARVFPQRVGYREHVLHFQVAGFIRRQYLKTQSPRPSVSVDRQRVITIYLRQWVGTLQTCCMWWTSSGVPFLITSGSWEPQPRILALSVINIVSTILLSRVSGQITCMYVCNALKPLFLLLLL